jgi:hypothetical protein
MFDVSLTCVRQADLLNYLVQRHVGEKLLFKDVAE